MGTLACHDSAEQREKPINNMRTKRNEAIQPHIGNFGTLLHRVHIKQAHRKAGSKGNESKSRHQKECAEFWINVVEHNLVSHRVLLYITGFL